MDVALIYYWYFESSFFTAPLASKRELLGKQLNVSLQIKNETAWPLSFLFSSRALNDWKLFICMSFLGYSEQIFFFFLWSRRLQSQVKVMIEAKRWYEKGAEDNEK